jgi:prevent-host-death family protein
VKIANVAQAKNSLSALLRRVKRGEVVIISERNRPVARLMPLAAQQAQDPDSHWLDDLYESGVLSPPTGDALDVPAFLAGRRAALPPEASLAKAVLEERREGR